MITINTLDIDRAKGVLVFCLSNNWYEELGFGNFDESYAALSKLFCDKRNNIKNLRDAYDPFTDSGRVGWNQYTRDEIKPVYLRELLPDLEAMSKEDLVNLSKKILQMIWLPDLEKLWRKINRDLQNEKNRAELILPEDVKSNLVSFLKDVKNYNIDEIGKTSVAVTTTQKQVSHVIPFSYIRQVCIFKPYMEAIDIYHNFAKDEVIHPHKQKTQETYDKIRSGEKPDYNRDKINEINFDKFISSLQNRDASGITKSIFRGKFDVISNIFCNKLRLENLKVDYVASLLEFVFETDIDLESLASSNEITVDHETRNLILYGAPGTGKSYQINTYVNNINATSYRTVFFSEYQNSDFIGSIKPSILENEVSYAFKEGILLKSLKYSLDNPSKKVVLIIEEINRGDAAAIFGDFFQLIDRNNQGESEYEIIVNDDVGRYLFDNADQQFKVKFPPNFYLVATMNSSDQGVFQLDTAFKRRWDFEYLSIDFTKHMDLEEFSDKKIEIKIENEEKYSWSYFAETINSLLSKDKIPEDRLLGPFFLSMPELKSEKLNRVIANKVLIYLWDDVLRNEDKNIIFSDNYNSFSKLQSDFTSGINVFSDNFTEILKQNTNVAEEDESLVGNDTATDTAN